MMRPGPPFSSYATSTFPLPKDATDSLITPFVSNTSLPEAGNTPAPAGEAPSPLYMLTSLPLVTLLKTRSEITVRTVRIVASAAAIP
jgi:hypothetical protein